MPSTPKIIGIIQLALAIIAAIAASGLINFDPELLATIIAVQNGLTGTQRLRKPEVEPTKPEEPEPPIN